jgi:N-acetylglucosamine-6-phosphate deacetylase
VIDGAEEFDHHAVVVDGGVVRAVVDDDRIPPSCEVVDLGGAILVSGLVDLQVNGGGDTMFNDTPTRAGLQTIVEAHRGCGTTTLLPTLITDTDEVMRAAIAAVSDAIATGERGVAGIHLEGPFLNPKRCGAHDPSLMRRMRLSDVEHIPAARADMAVLATVAPDMVDPGCIAALRARGVTVSIGHSDADDATVRAAIAEGATMVTHLFNATGVLSGRNPGVVGAALDSDVWVGLICDGHHVHDTSLRIALRAKPGRCVLVSDAMAPVGGVREGFMLRGRAVTVRDGRCQTDDRVLAGSAICLADGVRYCVERLGVSRAQALQMATALPARAAGLAEGVGRITVDRRCDMVVLDPATLALRRVLAS